MSSAMASMVRPGRAGTVGPVPFKGLAFDDVMIVMIVAVAVPLVLGLFPSLPIPSSVVEIAAGIVIGPALLDWVTDDQVISVFAQLGVALLLFLAGLELDFAKLRGRPLKLGLLGFVASLLIGYGLALPLGSSDVIIDPLLLSIILSATSLGIVCPVLKDAGMLDSRAGTLVVAVCSVAEFGSIVVLSVFFSPVGSTGLETVLNLGVLAIVVGLIAYLGSRQGPWRQRVDAVLYRLQDSSAQLRVRVAMLLMIALLVVSEGLGFDAILGSFLAGALLSAVTDPAREDEFGQVRHKLDGIGFGFFVPIFFVATGLSFPVDQLFSDWSTVLRVPMFFGMLVLARGLPVLVLRRDLARPELLPSALLQATSLSFIVVATQIGVELGELEPINAASLVAAGMLSVLFFPAIALWLLDRRGASVLGTDPEDRAVEGM
jgi:Kef-type K+ transport system membrane component KefB